MFDVLEHDPLCLDEHSESRCSNAAPAEIEQLWHGQIGENLDIIASLSPGHADRSLHAKHVGQCLKSEEAIRHCCDGVTHMDVLKGEGRLGPPTKPLRLSRFKRSSHVMALCESGDDYCAHNGWRAIYGF